MAKTERPPWQNFLEGDVIGKENTQGLRCYQVVIRVRPEGLQAIVKVRRGDEYQVAFVGAGGFQSLAGKVRDVFEDETKKWKDDEYPPI